MKKLLSLLACMMMIVSLSACGGSKAPAPAPSGSGAASGAEAPPAAAKGEPIVIKLTTTDPSTAPTVDDLKKCCKEIYDRTDGMVDIQVYADGQMLVYAEGVEAVMSNANLILVTSPSYLVDYVPVMSTLVSPYLFSSREVATAFFESDYFEGIRQECVDAGFYVICSDGLIGYRSVMANAPVKSVADMRKLSLRIPTSDVMVKLFNNLGCNYQTMSFSDVFNACQTGMLDGLEGVPLTITANSLWDAIKPLYYSRTNHVLDCYGLYVGYDFWMSIPEEYRAVIDEVLGGWGKMATADCVWEEENVIFKQYEEHGVNVVEIEDLSEFKAAGEAVIREQDRGEEVLAAIAEVEASLGKN